VPVPQGRPTDKTDWTDRFGERLMTIKSPEEIALIKKAQAIADRAFTQVVKNTQAGMTRGHRHRA